MPLRLSPEDQEEYQRLTDEANAENQFAIAAHNNTMARKARQRLSALYQIYKAKEIPLSPAEYRQPRELTLEERIEQIERKLGLNRWGV